MLTGLVIGALTAIGGGSDSVEPEYVDSVDFDSSIERRSAVDRSLRGLVESYEDTFDMTWSEAFTWHLDEDNREYGLLDVSACFEKIYEGASFFDGEVLVWISSPVKSGGILDLLDDYGVEADLRLVPQDLDYDQAAYRFMSGYGSHDYFAAELNEDDNGLIISTSTEVAAEQGPLLYGTIIDGVPVEYRWTE